jgi:hypothetical protein
MMPEEFLNYLLEMEPKLSEKELEVLTLIAKGYDSSTLLASTKEELLSLEEQYIIEKFPNYYSEAEGIYNLYSLTDLGIRLLM